LQNRLNIEKNLNKNEKNETKGLPPLTSILQTANILLNKQVLTTTFLPALKRKFKKTEFFSCKKYKKFPYYHKREKIKESKNLLSFLMQKIFTSLVLTLSTPSVCHTAATSLFRWRL